MTYFTVNDESHRHSPQRVATLGPPGTSSERAAGRILEILDTDGDVVLFRTYDDAAESVLRSESDVLVVANAFQGINSFYMDARLSVLSAFRMHTPLYGLAKRPDHALPSEFAVVSHPAPIPLIVELLPESMTCTEVICADSTSAAAAAVASGEQEVALTTEPACVAYDLVFISTLRPIEMVWTAFATECALR